MDKELIKTLLNGGTSVSITITGDDVRTLALELYRMVSEEMTVASTADEEYVTAAEAREMLKRSQVTLWRWNDSGTLRPNDIGLYRKSDVVRVLNKRTPKAKI